MVLVVNFQGVIQCVQEKGKAISGLSKDIFQELAAGSNWTENAE